MSTPTPWQRFVTLWHRFFPHRAVPARAVKKPRAAVPPRRPPIGARKWPPATARTTYDGHTVNWMTRAALEEAARRLGYTLTIIQGSYHKGVGASAGTHDGGGVVDLAPWDWQHKIPVLREVGFDIWHRLPSEGPWEEHLHAVLRGDPDLSRPAYEQTIAYRNGRNGLANNGPDNGGARPTNVFVYPPK